MSGYRVHGWAVPGGLDADTLEPGPECQVEQFRWCNGVDLVRIGGLMFTPDEADQWARSIQSAAQQAAAHNLGATR